MLFFLLLLGLGAYANPHETIQCEQQDCHPAVAMLSIEHAQGVRYCTATLIALDKMVTAADCIPFDVDRDRWGEHHAWVHFPAVNGLPEEHIEIQIGEKKGNIVFLYFFLDAPTRIPVDFRFVPFQERENYMVHSAHYAVSGSSMTVLAECKLRPHPIGTSMRMSEHVGYLGAAVFDPQNRFVGIVYSRDTVDGVFVTDYISGMRRSWAQYAKYLLQSPEARTFGQECLGVCVDEIVDVCMGGRIGRLMRAAARIWRR